MCRDGMLEKDGNTFPIEHRVLVLFGSCRTCFRQLLHNLDFFSQWLQVQLQVHSINCRVAMHIAHPL